MESPTLPRAVGVNATVVASEIAGFSHSSGEAAEKTSEAAERTSTEVARVEETATATPMGMETTVGGTTSSEPPAQQIVPRGKDPIVAPSASGFIFASPHDLGLSAASVVGRSLEEAMDKMLQEYIAQHQGVKSLIQVIALDLPSVYLLPQPPSVQSTSRLGCRLGTCIFRRGFSCQGAAPCATAT